MYVQNDSDVPILYTAVGGAIAHGTILPGQGDEVDARAVLNLSLSTDDGSPLPDSLSVRLSS